MQRSFAYSALLVAAIGLSACAGTENRGVESVHQAVVSRADYVLDVNASPQGLAAGEAQRIDGWLGSVRLGYGDRLSIDEGSAYANPRLREDVASVAARYGLLLSDVAPVTVGAVAAGTARVVLTRTRAEVPGCPDYSRPSQPNFDAHASSNFGCGLNSTFTAMVANPEDLVRGQDGSLMQDANAASKAINSYRAAKPTGEGGLRTQNAGGGRN